MESKAEQESEDSRGILVKLVICVVPGHWKNRIINSKDNMNVGWFLGVNITPHEKKMMGHLI